MKRTFGTAVILVALATSIDCGGGPSGPAPLDLDGPWFAFAEVEAVSGASCLGPELRLRRYVTSWLSIDPAGSSSTAWVEDFDFGSLGEPPGASCVYDGTITTTAFRFEMRSCERTQILGRRCANGREVDLFLVSDSFEGIVIPAAQGSLEGTWQETWDVFDSASGDLLSTLTVTDSFQTARPGL